MSVDTTIIVSAQDLFKDDKTYTVNGEPLAPDPFYMDKIICMVSYGNCAVILNMDVNILQKVDCVEAGSQFTCQLCRTEDGYACWDLEKVIAN